MPTDIELWKTIEELPRYQISNKGNVKSLIGTEKQLKPTPDIKGYLRVKLSFKPLIKGQYRTKCFRVHRLVAQYFCEDFEEKKDVHHKNLNRVDNDVSNLVCLTKEEHAELHRKLHEQEQKEKHKKDKLTCDKEVYNNDNCSKSTNNNSK